MYLQKKESKEILNECSERFDCLSFYFMMVIVFLWHRFNNLQYSAFFHQQATHISASSSKNINGCNYIANIYLYLYKYIYIYLFIIILI